MVNFSKNLIYVKNFKQQIKEQNLESIHNLLT